MENETRKIIEGCAMAVEGIIKIAEGITGAIVKVFEEFKASSIGATFLQWATDYIAIENCKNKRVKHLARHGSTARIRKKNIKRAKEIYKHET